jgi:hypothetical protein
MKKISILLISLFIAACVTGYNPGYYFNEIQVVNLTGGKITNVDLRFDGSKKTLDCDEVAYHAMCHDRFSKIRYPQQLLELSWIHSDGQQKSQLMDPKIAAYYFPAFALRLVLEINPDESVKPFFEQETPDRSIYVS